MVHCGAHGTATYRSSRMQWHILGGMVHCGFKVLLLIGHLGIEIYRLSK